MKIRTGFVSNSSSSSFIIGVTKNDFTNERFTKKITIDFPLEDLVEQVIKTSDEFIKMIEDDYWYHEDDIKTRNFSKQDLETIKYLDAHPDNYIIILCVGDDYGNSISRFLYNNTEYITKNSELNILSKD